MPEQKPILDALQTSVIINRRDQSGQIAWTEWRAGIAYGCPANPGDLVGLNSSGKIDPCLLPTTGSNVRVNGTAVSDPNFNDNLPAAPPGSSNVKWQFDLITGNVSAYYTTSGTSVSFDQILSGDNTSATMVVSGTASLSYSGTGVVNANEIGGINVAGNAPAHEGQLLISQPGNTTAVWADPLVQGLYPAGSSVASPPPFAPPTTIQPVLIGGEGADGKLHNILTTNSGAVVTVSEGLADSANHFAVSTGSTTVNVPGPLTPILSIKPQIAATVTFFLTGMDVFTATAVAMFQVVKNGALTGASFTNVTGSNMQQDTSATSVTGGTVMDTGYSTTGTRTQIYEVQFTVGDTFTLVVASDINGHATKAVGALRWAEQVQPL